MSEKIKLGEVLVQAGLIDDSQLEAAVGEQSRWGNRLGETLVQLGYVTEPELVRTLSRHYGIPGVHLEGKQIEPDVLALLPVEVAEEYRCLPLFKKRVSGGELLYLGMAHPEDLRAVDDVSFDSRPESGTVVYLQKRLSWKDEAAGRVRTPELLKTAG